MPGPWYTHAQWTTKLVKSFFHMQQELMGWTPCQALFCLGRDVVSDVLNQVFDNHSKDSRKDSGG